MASDPPNLSPALCPVDKPSTQDSVSGKDRYGEQNHMKTQEPSADAVYIGDQIRHGLSNIADSIAGGRSPENVAMSTRDVANAIEEHPAKRMLDAGLMVTINSDDPAFFGGYVGENYQAVQDGLGLDDRTLCELARNSFRAAFIDDEKKRELLAEVDAYMVGS